MHFRSPPVASPLDDGLGFKLVPWTLSLEKCRLTYLRVARADGAPTASGENAGSDREEQIFL
ncbi:hypothetical protein AJ87_13470 [Rhizobium yanglingense]|nr:hypothetical protein AJ87_13470 [Rhizobium yanglingense]